MSANLAIRLEMSGVSTARAWLAMQTNYDLSKAIPKEQSHDQDCIKEFQMAVKFLQQRQQEKINAIARARSIDMIR